MPNLHVTDKADLGVMYDADIIRYTPESVQKAGATRERFIQFYGNCRSIGFQIGDKVMGGAVFDGNEVHLAILPQYYGRWALLLKPGLEWLFSLQDPVFVRIEKFNEKCLQFMDRNNWRRVKDEGRYVTFEVTNNASHVFNKRSANAIIPVNGHPHNITPLANPINGLR